MIEKQITEEEQLATFTKNEKRFLSRRMCAWCEHQIDRKGCSAIHEPCTVETRNKRRVDCLKTYRPRKKNVTIQK